MRLAEPAWLLHVTRRFAADEQLHTAATFARGDGLLQSVNPSQVSRWESGKLAPVYPVVRRYETVCGLADGQLQAAIDLVNRYDRPVAFQPRLRRPLPADPAEEASDLLELALSGKSFTGPDWDRLTALLGALPQALLLADDWRRLLGRGLDELDVVVGLAYRQRAEAMSRLAGHPRAARHVADLVRERLTDLTAQVYSEAVALLQYSNHPEAYRVLQDVIVNPVGPNALRAALFTAAVIVRSRRTPHDAAVTFVRLSLELARDPDQPYRVRRSAADVLLALRPQTRASIARELSRSPTELSVSSIIAGHGPHPREALRGLRGRILASLEAELGPVVHDQAPLLRLLDYVTVETNDELRNSALQLLNLLPFGDALARAYVAELEHALEGGDAVGAHEALGVLICLAPREDLELLTRLAAGELDPPDDQIPVEASWAVGNAALGSTHGASAEERIAAAVRRSWTDTGHADLLSGRAYALGMRGRLDLLHDLDPPPDAAGAAAWEVARRWWLQHVDPAVCLEGR